jgi:phosphotriesterase-related protein
MASGERRGLVQTVKGLIRPEQLGPTLMHEHLVIDLNAPAVRNAIPDYASHEPPVRQCDCFKLNWGQTANPTNFRLHEEPILLAELQEMKAAGGVSLVELTVGGLSPKPTVLARLAEESGVQIVMGCGHYVGEYQDPANAERTADDFAAEMITHLTEGAWDTDVKAGIIGEIGCQWPWTDQEKRVMAGALVAQQETGAAINVHPGRAVEQPFEVAEFVRAAGGPVERCIISHIDRTITEVDDLLRLADTGCVIEFDLFGWEATNYPPNPAIDMPNDGVRLKLLRTLINHGHLERIVISQDICTRTRLVHYGGHGYQHIFANVLPLMRRRGFSDAEIDQIVSATPARLLAFR